MIPNYQAFMLPLLKLAASGSEDISTQFAVNALADELSLTEDERRELLPSGVQTKLANRIGWAATYLRKAGLLEAGKRGYIRITSRGREYLELNPIELNSKILRKYPEFIEFENIKTSSCALDSGEGSLEDSQSDSITPSEALEKAYANLRNELLDELLAKLKKSSPTFFEHIVVDLLVRMGYGGSRADAGKAIGKSGDGGIDGIIKEDKLGLDVLYIQAKRWDNTKVGRPEVMQFAGALQGQRASKGIFITTSRFTDEARSYVSQIGSKIVLIDGIQLSNLMVDHDVGVSTLSLYPVKRIDTDYFEEEI